MKEIIFSGGSHYGSRALISLQRKFDKIYLLQNNSEDILQLKRPQDEFVDNFLSVNCKYVFLGGHSEFISEELLNEKIFINVHGSLLPKYRGMHSTFWAIMNGEENLGITYHLVDKYMDSGDILAQYSFAYNNQSIHQINEIIDLFVEEYTGEVVTRYLENEIVPIKQNIDEVTFGCKRNLKDCEVNFNMENLYLYRFFRALTPPYPLPRIVVKNKIYEVLDSYIIKKDFYSEIGRVLNIDYNGVWIKTKEGFLIIKKVRNIDTGDIVELSDLVGIGYRFITNTH